MLQVEPTVNTAIRSGRNGRGIRFAAIGATPCLFPFRSHLRLLT